MPRQVKVYFDWEDISLSNYKNPYPIELEALWKFDDQSTS